MSKILIFSDFYPPAFKAGGSCRSVYNIVGVLSKQLSVDVFTRSTDIDHQDLLVASNRWLSSGNTRLFYQRGLWAYISFIACLLFTNTYSTIYLNSFFSFRFSFIPLLVSFFKKFVVIMAPRGELSPAALRFSRSKKCVYIFVFKFLCKRVNYVHLSNQLEKQYSSPFFPRSREVVLSDMPSYIPSYASSTELISPVLPLRIVFWGRIHPIKGLHFILDVFRHVHIELTFDIYGPVEDSEYWAQCTSLIAKMPHQVVVRYHGVLAYENLYKSLKDYHLAVFPSLSENFGHVIIEALALSLPVFTSDNVPWQSTVDGSLTCIPLDVALWVDYLESFPAKYARVGPKLKKSSRSFYQSFYDNCLTSYLESPMFSSNQ